jgi:hypothetical protein
MLTLLLGLLIDAYLLAILLSPAHLTFDLKAHEEEHCRTTFSVPQEYWVYIYTDEASKICSEAVGGYAHGCAIKRENHCEIILPKSYEET